MLPIPANELNGSGALGPYWTFYHAVVAEQLRRWLPERPCLLLDLSGGRGRWPAQAAGAGHHVIEVVDFRRAPDPWLRDASNRIRRVRADDLGFLPDASIDAVIAEERVLSLELMAESTMEDVVRVLKPGGRVLACVDSLVLGMAIMAEQNYWAHLCQTGTGEVMLVPWPDGSITRCFNQRPAPRAAGRRRAGGRVGTAAHGAVALDRGPRAGRRHPGAQLARPHGAGRAPGRRRHGGHPPCGQRPQARVEPATAPVNGGVPARTGIARSGRPRGVPPGGPRERACRSPRNCRRHRRRFA